MFLRSNALQQDFKLTNGSMTIGRLGECQIVLPDGSVTKQHLEVRVSDDRVLVRDLMSRNNTSVNKREIRGLGWIELKANDRIKICEYDFQLLHEHMPTVESGSCVVDNGPTPSSWSGSDSISLSKLQLEDSQPYSQLRALLEITQTLRDVLRTEDVLERAASMLLRIFPAVDRAAIVFIEDDGRFTPKWWQLRHGDPASTIRMSGTIVQHVRETSEAIITHDALADYADAQSVQELAMRSVMCAPLINADDQVFGLIHVDAGKPNKFAALDLEVLASVAMQLALAINFSRLHTVAMQDAILRRDVEQARAVQLAPGDSLVIYSDGFPDAEHQPSDRRFGTATIAKLFAEFEGSASDFIVHMVDHVDRFMEGGTQFDDMCMVCLRRCVQIRE